MSLDSILLHPFFVHFPIALFFFELFLLISARFQKDLTSFTSYLKFARLSFHTAAVGFVLAGLTGWRDAGGTLQAMLNEGVKPHFLAACTLAGILLLRILLWKKFNLNHAKCHRVQSLAAVVTVAAVIVTAYWGGKLVYS